MVTFFVILNALISLLHLMGVIWAILVMVLQVSTPALFGLNDDTANMALNSLGQVPSLVINLLISVLAAVSAVGLYKRTSWGYYTHIVTAVFAISPCCLCCMGIVYTIPAIIFACLPEFRAEFPELST